MGLWRGRSATNASCVGYTCNFVSSIDKQNVRFERHLHEAFVRQSFTVAIFFDIEKAYSVRYYRTCDADGQVHALSLLRCTVFAYTV